MQKLPFSELGLSEATLKAVEKLGFEQTSPIQSAAIPVLMAGKDVVGQSATGSGKTAAFAIPGIERVLDTDRKVQILVLVPTRELATQVAEEFSRLSFFRPKVHAVPIYGGASYDRQFSELRKGPQIVIGTPGRIIDHLQRNTLDLSEVKLAVLDECDRMLDMGFREDMERILSAAPKERQTVFFSATLPPAIKRLIEQFSRSPEHIKIEGTAMTVPTVEQIYFDVPPRAKLDALCRLLDIHDARLSIVFANTQRTVDEITDSLLARGYAADRLHGGISQALRTRTMGKFKKSEFEILVATDVAGRGLDVDDLDLVINFDLPYDPEDYVHRIGRTGRAGRKGVAMTLISGREVYRLQNVERFTKMRIRRGRVPSWDQVEEKRLSEILDKVRATLEDGKHSSHGIYIDRLMDDGHSATDLAAALLHQLCASEGLESDKSGAADPFAQRPGAPGAPAPAPATAKPAPAAKKPLKAQSEPENIPRPAHSQTSELLEHKPSTPAQVAKVPRVVAGAESPSEGVSRVVAGAESLSEGASRVVAGAESPSEGASGVVAGAESPSEGASGVAAEAERVSDGAPGVVAEAESVAKTAPSAPAPGLTPEEEAARAAKKAAKKAAKAIAAAAVAAEQARVDAEEGVEDEEEGEEDEEPETGSEMSRPAPSTKAKGKSAAGDLPAPSAGYKWIALNAGNADGLTPRDVVDAITEDGAFEGKDVGLIKIDENTTSVQVKAASASAIMESLQGATLGDKELVVHYPRTIQPPAAGKPRAAEREDRPRPRRDDARPPYQADRPRRDDDRPAYNSDRPRRDDAGDSRPPHPYTPRPGGYDKKPGGFGDKPGGFRKDYGARDDRPAGFARPARPYGDKPGGGYKKPGSYGDKPGGFKKYGETQTGTTRSWSKDDSRPAGGDRPPYRPREDDRGSAPRPPRKNFGGPKKGPGRW